MRWKQILLFGAGSLVRASPLFSRLHSSMRMNSDCGGGRLRLGRRSRTRIIAVLGVASGLVLLANTSPLRAQERPVRSITVSGTVDTKVAPDQIAWQISLTSTDPSLAKAKARSDEQVKALVALQEKLGLEKGDLQTGVVSVNREYERDQIGRRGEFKHFAVNRSITIRQRDLRRFDEFLSALVSSTDMEVHFSFESSRTQEIRAESRLKALRVARDKAAAMAEALGAKLARVLTINEHSSAEPWRNPMSNVSFTQSTPPADVATETFVPGAISVPVTVYVTFEME